MKLDWKKLLRIAYQEAQKSKWPSTQNGAILIDNKGKVLLSAVNGYPDGIKVTEERKIYPLRSKFGVCAERNLIYQAAKNGIKTKGLTMICCWAACTDCARAIIQSGIKRLVTHKQALDRSYEWKESIDFAFTMLKEAGVEIIIYDGKIGAGKILRRNEFWEP
jgi:dCMP deaminase